MNVQPSIWSILKGFRIQISGFKEHESHEESAKGVIASLIEIH